MTKRRLCILAMALISISASKCVFADDSVTKDAVFQTVIEDYLTLTLDDSNMSVETTMTSTFGSGYVTASVATNNAYGYTLSMQDSDDRNGLERDGFATASEENKSKYNIPSVTADTAYANLADDSWGYFLGSTAADQATYKQIPFEATEILSSDSNTSGLETARVNFGVKTAEFRPSGLYEDEITFTLVANGPPPVSLEQAYGAAGKSKVTVSGNQYYVMQDMTPDICSNTTEIPSNLQVVDIRDNTVYLIGKLVDNRCWLLDNLALDLLDSDVQTTMINNPSYTNANVDSLSTLFFGVRKSANQATHGVSTWTTLESYSDPQIDTLNKDVLPTTYNNTDEPLASIVTSGNWKVGAYYNYCAASAGSYCYGSGISNGNPVDKANTAIDAEYDICPSGWRMPTGSSYDAINRPDGGEYQALATVITGDTNGSFSGDPNYTNFRKALHLPLSGDFGYGSAYNQGRTGRFWSSTYYDSLDMYPLSVFTSEISIGAQFNYERRYTGCSVRCINKTGTEPAPSGN